MANENHDDLLLYGAIAVGIFIAGKAILNTLGIDPADKSTVDAQTNLPASQNAFSPQYQPAISLFNANPSYDENDNLLTMQQYYQVVKQLYDSNDGSLSESVRQIAQMAETLHDQLTGWHLTTDENAVIAVFSQMTSQLQLANVSTYYLYNFGDDLLNSLKGNLFKFGLSESALAQVIKLINNLPVQ